jgi:transposase, IS30 family
VPGRWREPQDGHALEAWPQVHQPTWRDLGVSASRGPEEADRAVVGSVPVGVERIRIADLLRTGSSVREIGRQLGRSAATISREIHRAVEHSDGVYHPHAAHDAAVKRRARPNELKIVEGTEIYRFLADRLAKRWSPQQISHALTVEYPDRADMHVCAETIYQAIYRPDSPLRDCSPRPLRTGRLRRHHYRHTKRTNRFIEPMKMIDTRPHEADDRATAGHWEGDLIVGRLNQSAIGTLVERTTRFTILIPLDGCRSAENLRDALIAEFLKLPLHLRRSLTWDQGIEMACHGEFSRAIGMPVVLLRAGQPVAARHQREHQRSATRLLPERHGPVPALR